MHKTIREAIQFLGEFLPLSRKETSHFWIAPPFTALAACVQKAEGSPLWIGAQNVSHLEEGALTGEISAKMVREAGGRFCLVGHSERRTVFKEPHEWVQKKIKQALLHQLVPILCIGELEQEREAGKTAHVLREQLREGLKGLPAAELKELVIAYEPVWAIGTGKTASAQMAQEAHALIRKEIAAEKGEAFAKNLSILYGGSVKPSNLEELIQQPDIDGALVGGAALEVGSFVELVRIGSHTVKG